MHWHYFCTALLFVLGVCLTGGEQLQFLGEPPFRAYASRSTLVGQVLYQLFAVDSDTGSLSNGTLYSIQQTLTAASSSRHFSLREDTGELVLTSLFSSLVEHTLVIEALSDSQTTVQTNLIVTVIPESDSAPRYEQEAYDLSVSEGHPVDQPFSVIRAFPLTRVTSQVYEIVSGTSGGSFSIDANSGLLNVARSLDREQIDRYSLTVRYSFNDEDGYIDTEVDITVLDTNDNSPLFESSLYNITVPENTAVSTSVLTISATDADLDSNAVVQYFMESSDFSLDSQTGVITVSSELDYERTSRYQIAVTASDGGTPASNSTAVLVINIENIGDECPRFENPLYIADISSSELRANLPILTVTARDPDNLSDVTYAIVSGNSDSSVLTLDPNTGALMVADDSNLIGQYLLNVSASDATCLMMSFASVQIRIVDSNDHDPEFVTPCNAMLTENASVGTAVVTLRANDADTGLNGQVSYHLLNTSYFSINSSTGVVSTNEMPGSYDRETWEVLRVGVVAIDGGSRQGYCLLTVTLTDLNDNAPTFTSPVYNISLSPDTPPLSFVAKMAAFDADTGSNSDIVYSFTSPTQSPFVIDPTSGEIMTTAPLNATTGDVVLSVMATDMGDQVSLSSTAVVHFSLASGAPVFSQPYYNVTVCENTPVGKPILTVEASSSPTYQLVSGADYSSNSAGTFSLTGGLIHAGSQDLVDYEKLNSRKSFLFGVLAVNQAGTSSAIVEIFVFDIDDNPPVLESGYAFTLAENRPRGLVVTQLIAQDADSGTNGEIAYRLPDPSPFFAVSNAGVITSLRVFDYENTNEVLSGLLRVELYNPSPAQTPENLTEFCGNDVFLRPQNAIVNIAWSIVDQNDNAPSFDQTMYNVLVPEDQPVLTDIFTFSASDRDTSDRAELSFLITGGNDGTFATEGDSLVLVGRLDFETTPSYNLSVQVTDGVHNSKGSCSHCTASISITVSNVDDEPPVFSDPTHQLEVVEMLPLGTTVLTLSAQDVDTPTITYRLSGLAQGRLSVSSSGDIVVSGPLDREALPNGMLPFLAFAEGGGVATTDVTLTLLDINDNVPRFKEIFGGRVQENTPPGDEGVPVTRVTAQDLDRGRNGTVTYSLVDGTENGFRINSETGVITAHEEFDREAQSSHLLTVQAMDNGTPLPLTSTSVVTIEIGDVNDNPPFFPFPFMFARTYEDAPIGTHVLDIPAADPDNITNVNFTLLMATPPGLYDLDPNTGAVTVAGSLDYEIPLHRTATLHIVIQDPLFVAETVGVLSIRVLDRNDNVPIVQPPVYTSTVGSTMTIPENLPPDQTLATISATDADEGLNGEIVFSIVSGDEGGDFQISSGGMVSNARTLDYETTNHYTLTVAVSDRGEPPQSSLVSLEFNVLDINDNAPMFAQSVYQVSVPENVPPTDSILQVSAMDPDTEIGGQIRSYAIVAGNIGMRFSLNSTTGVLGTEVMFDREERDSYTLTVTATDRGADPQTGTGMIEVTVTDMNDNPSLENGRQMIYINAGGGLIRTGLIGQVYFPDPDTSNTFISCLDEDNTFFTFFAVSSIDCTLSLLREELDVGTYPLSVLGRDGRHISVTTNVIINVANESFPEEGVITVTINATAGVYYERGLNISLPSVFAQYLNVEVRDINVVSLQPGYHAPLHTLDMTFSVRQASDGYIPPIEVLNLLFQNREELFVGEYGVVALPTDPCVAEPCSNQARCVSTRSFSPTQPALDSGQYILLAPQVTLGYECVCAPGTSGEFCEINYDDCYSNPCMHNADCADSVQGYVCDCPDGTSGPDCSFNPDECASDPCQNDAECINGFNTYTCSCLPGYYGRECQYAHFQISPSCVANPCQNGATCSPGRDGFICLCPAGFNGSLCESPVQVQGGCVGNPCYNGSLCEDTSEGPMCRCSVGFTGPFCRWPLDNCELEPCENGATCEAGLYGSFLCTCPTGFAGETCAQRIPACEARPCLNGGRCDDLQDGGFSCQCVRDYTGERCEVPLLPPDLCETNPCPPSSNCSSGANSVTCSCPPGEYGPECSLSSGTSPCSSNPCLHGGRCMSAPPPMEYACLCSRGFTGANCEVDIDDCSSDVCLNGGTCQDGVGGFVCLCSEGVTGDLCQIFCPEGQTGEFCDVHVPQCAPTSCSNGGTCIESNGGFECQCPATHTGLTCETINNCTTTRCLNGGSCTDISTGGAECSCVSGFNGPQCQLLAATFTGSSTQNSYRAYRPLQLQGRGRVTLEFATTSQEGLLLFSTQYQEGASRDWVAVEVVGGLLRVSLALGSDVEGVTVMGSSVGVSDGLWHQVSIEINGKWYEVLLDQCQMLEEGLLVLSECRAAATTPGNSSFLDLGLPLWVGGVPFVTPPTPFQLSSVGFAGCVRNLAVDGDLMDMDSHIQQSNSARGCGQIDDVCGGGAGGRCGSGTCVPSLGRFSCLCPPLMAGDSCENAATSLMFSGGSYAQYTLNEPITAPDTQTSRKRQTTPTIRSTLSDTLSFRFRTELAEGILFHIGGLSTIDDFSYVTLRTRGRVSYHINLGAGEERVDFPDHIPAVDDALWHYVELERTALDLRVTLDNISFSHTLGGNQLYMDVEYGQFYAGGPPRRGEGSYTGCLQDVRVDGSVLPTSDSNRFASVVFQGNTSTVRVGCGLRGCFPDPCEGGVCEERGQRDFICVCDDGSRLISRPCSAVSQDVPYLLLIIIVAVLVGLTLLLATAIVVMICWKKYANRKRLLLNLDGRTSPMSEVVLATRDCVVISNDAGGGEQDTTMTEDKWQQSIPMSRKGDRSNESSSSTTSSSDVSISKPPSEREAQQLQVPANQTQTVSTNQPLQRAQSPVISAFIDQRLEALRKEYPDHDSLQVFSEEGEGTSRVSLNSFCSYQSKEEEYTVERLRKAGPAFQKFAGLLEVLAADEEETVDMESEVVHTGLTQTQTQSQGAWSQGAGSQGNGGFYF